MIGSLTARCSSALSPEVLLEEFPRPLNSLRVQYQRLGLAPRVQDVPLGVQPVWPALSQGFTGFTLIRQPLKIWRAGVLPSLRYLLPSVLMGRVLAA